MMTPEQLQHEEDYFTAKSAYEDAFSMKRQAENEVASIVNRRQSIISSINELVSERKLNSESLSEIQESTAQNSDFDASVQDTDSKLEAASLGFSAIGESSMCVPQKLTEVFEERNRRSKTSIQSAFDQMKTIGNSIQNKIDELSQQISQLESEQEDGQSREQYLSMVIAEQDHIMNNAVIEMAYHKRCMEA